MSDRIPSDCAAGLNRCNEKDLRITTSKEHKMKRIFALAMLLAFAGAQSASAGDVWLSAFGAANLGDGSVSFSNPALNHDESDPTQSLYIYMRPENSTGAFNGASLNVIATNSGVIEFVGSEVFNPSVGSPFGTFFRWDEVGGTINGTVAADSVLNMTGAAVSALGIDNAADLGMRDGDGTGGTTGGFLFARIDYNILGTGSTDLYLQVGENDIASPDANVPVEVQFGNSEAGDRFNAGIPANRGESGPGGLLNITADASITVAATGGPTLSISLDTGADPGGASNGSTTGNDPLAFDPAISNGSFGFEDADTGNGADRFALFEVEPDTGPGSITGLIAGLNGLNGISAEAVSSPFAAHPDANLLVTFDGSGLDPQGVISFDFPDYLVMSASVPEPASLVLLAIGALMGMTVRRRRNR
jgi:hypothetical protein